MALCVCIVTLCVGFMPVAWLDDLLLGISMFQYDFSSMCIGLSAAEHLQLVDVSECMVDLSMLFPPGVKIPKRPMT